MLSKKRIGLIRSLEFKKNRELTGLFITEGHKICGELLVSGIPIHSIYFTKAWGEKNVTLKEKVLSSMECHEISEEELSKISLLTTPQDVLALVVIPNNGFSWQEPINGPVLLLDQLQDPGNLGTIIRTADWFGFNFIISSPGTVDFYHPKVIQASMGSIWRVKCIQTPLNDFLALNKSNWNWPVYAAVMNGKSIYEVDLLLKAFYLFGSEAVGISKELLQEAGHLITVPSMPRNNQHHAESLNVGVATALVMAELRRQPGK